MAALAVAATGATPPSAIKLRRNLLPAHGVQISNSLVQLNIADMHKQSRAWCSALIWCCLSLMPVHSTFISIAQLLSLANAVKHSPPWQLHPGP